MNISIYAEDDMTIILELEKLLQKYTELSGININITVFKDQSKLLADNVIYDCYILVATLYNNAISFSIEISTKKRHPMIILISFYLAHAVTAIEAGVFRFILAPIEHKHFFKTLDDICKNMDSHMILIKDNNGNTRKIFLYSVLYIESFNHKTKVHFENYCIITSKTISEWMNILDPSFFVKVYKGVIVNMKSIDFVIENKIILYDSTILYISRTSLKSFHQKFSEYLDAISQI